MQKIITIDFHYDLHYDVSIITPKEWGISMKFRSKIILYFLISILVPATLITTVIYAGSTHIINQKMDELVEKNLDSARLLVQQRLAFIDELTTLISVNPLIQDVLNEPATQDSNRNIEQIIQLDHALDSYYISNYYTSASSPIVPVLYMIDRPGYQQFHISDRIRDISELYSCDWYTQAASRGTSVVTDTAQNAVIITRKLYNLQNIDSSRYAALLTVSLDRSFFHNLLQTYKPTPNSRLVLCDSNAHIISSSEDLSSEEISFFSQTFSEANLTGKAFHTKYNGASAVASARTLANADWTIFAVTDLNDLNASQNMLTKIVIFIIFVSMGIALFTALLLSRNLSRPITAIVDSMHKVGGGNFTIDLPYHKNDEFKYLIDQYNQMLIRISQLIKELCISEANKQKAEIESREMQLKALQAQINPHFLYNTLDSINLYAIKYNVPEICDMITSLSDFFRYSLNAGSTVISLEEEISHTRSYLELVAIRRGPDMKYQFQIPGSLRKTRILKLTLQPLVENALQHGQHPKNGKLSILISGSLQEDQVILTISDNGVGSDTEKLNRILTDPDTLSNDYFAICNVQKRLQNKFGKNAGLFYKDTPGGGVTVDVRIPFSYNTVEKETSHDSRTSGR